MGFAVYHSQKGSGSGGGLGNHIDRAEGKEFSYKTADPEKREQNYKQQLSNNYDKMPMEKAIEHRITNGKTKGRGVRKDAIKYLAHILTGSHEDMKKIFTTKEANKWVAKNYNFIAEEFGADNIIRFDVHLDEKTPHIHCVTVPITKDGRLSAKEMMGNRIDLQQRQNRYAEQMQEFGLERGLKNTGVTHEDANEYNKRIERSKEIVKETIQEPSKNFLNNYWKFIT